MEILSDKSLFCKEKYDYLVGVYNVLFLMFNKALGPYLESVYGVNSDAEVVGVERGLGNEKCQIFWDYLGASHGDIESISRTQNNVIDKQFTYRCIKLEFKDGKSIVLSTAANPDSLPNGVISLDILYKKLGVADQNVVDKLLFDLNGFESKHFTSQKFKQNFGRVKGSSNDQLYQVLNIKESTLH